MPIFKGWVLLKNQLGLCCRASGKEKNKHAILGTRERNGSTKMALASYKHQEKIKRDLTGTYHNISVKHLPRYIDEFVFGLNEGNCQVDTLDRIGTLVKGFGGKRIRYKDLIK